MASVLPYSVQWRAIPSAHIVNDVFSVTVISIQYLVFFFRRRTVVLREKNKSTKGSNGRNQLESRLNLQRETEDSGSVNSC